MLSDIKLLSLLQFSWKHKATDPFCYCGLEIVEWPSFCYIIFGCLLLYILYIWLWKLYTYSICFMKGVLSIKKKKSGFWFITVVYISEFKFLYLNIYMHKIQIILATLVLMCFFPWFVLHFGHSVLYSIVRPVVACRLTMNSYLHDVERPFEVKCSHV